MPCTRTRLVSTLLLALVAAHVVRAAPPRQPVRNTTSAAPTYSVDIVPILEQHCVPCHRPGRPVPMALRTLGEVRPWLRSIRSAVETRRMPPWTADPRFGAFANNPTLSVSEVDTILRWIDAGAPAGAGHVAAPDTTDSAWTHPSGRPPDLIVEAPASIVVPASTQWPTFNVYSRLPAQVGQQDRFVEAVQLLPGNRRVTHHSSLSMRQFPAGVSLGRTWPWPGGPLLDGLPVLTDRNAFERAAAPVPSAAAAFSSGGVSHLTYYFPGNDGLALYPASAGKRLPADAFVEWSLHYAADGAAQSDRHRAGFWLHAAPPAHEVITLRVGDFHIVNAEEVRLPAGLHTNPGHAAVVDLPATCDGHPCTRPSSTLPPIPAGDGNWRVTGITPVLDDVTIYSMSPHGHLRLKDMTYVVTAPDGRETTVLSVPRYDFDWQFVYRFVSPLRVAAGSTIKAIARYDNSRANRRNPAPEREVQWSEQSSDEMFNGFMDLSLDRLGVDDRPVNVASPTRPLVIAAGCAVREADGRWLLVHGTSPARSSVGHSDAGETAATRRTADDNRYRLLGAAEFGEPRELVASSNRALYTTAVTANATGVLRTGRSVGVKGVLIGGEEPAINLVSVWPVPGECPQVVTLVR